MLTYGSQVNPSLGRTDYSAILQGGLARAQGIQQAGQAYGQMFSNFGQNVARGIEVFAQKQEEKQNEQAGISFIKTRFPGISDAEAKAGLKAAGGPAAFVKFRQDEEERAKAQQAFSYASMLSQGGGNVPSPISNQTLSQFSPEARMAGQSAYLQQARQAAELEKTRAETLNLLSPKAKEPPSGYRFTGVGNLEEIPGGPAAAARERENAQLKMAQDAADRQKQELDLKINAAQEKANTEQEKKRLADEALKSAAEDARLSADTTLREIDKARSLIDKPFAQGFGSSIGGFFSGSPANDLENSYDVIRSNEALSRIIALKKASPTGSTGFGALNLKELETLQSRFAKLTRSASDVAAKEALNDLERIIGKAFPEARAQIEAEMKAKAGTTLTSAPMSPAQIKAGSRFEIVRTTP